jgi:hypothetical protein
MLIGDVPGIDLPISSSRAASTTTRIYGDVLGGFRGSSALRNLTKLKSIPPRYYQYDNRLLPPEIVPTGITKDEPASSVNYGSSTGVGCV